MWRLGEGGRKGCGREGGRRGGDGERRNGRGGGGDEEGQAKYTFKMVDWNIVIIVRPTQGKLIMSKKSEDDHFKFVTEKCWFSLVAMQTKPRPMYEVENTFLLALHEYLLLEKLADTFCISNQLFNKNTSQYIILFAAVK